MHPMNLCFLLLLVECSSNRYGDNRFLFHLTLFLVRFNGYVNDLSFFFSFVCFYRDFFPPIGWLSICLYYYKKSLTMLQTISLFCCDQVRLKWLFMSLFDSQEADRFIWKSCGYKVLSYKLKAQTSDYFECCQQRAQSAGWLTINGWFTSNQWLTPGQVYASCT